jgi:Flp pilus assembly pilin Flp
MLKPNRRNSFKAQGLVEYALILALVAVAAVATLAVVGPAASNVYCNVIASLSSKTCTSTESSSTGDSKTGDTVKTLTVTITQVNSQHAWFTVTDSTGAEVMASVTASDTAGLVLTCDKTKCSNPPSEAFPGGDVITIKATYNGVNGQASITYNK